MVTEFIDDRGIIKPIPDNLEVVKTKSGREVIKRKDQKIATVEELKSKGQEEVKKFIQGFAKVTFTE